MAISLSRQRQVEAFLDQLGVVLDLFEETDRTVLTMSGLVDETGQFPLRNLDFLGEVDLLFPCQQGNCCHLGEVHPYRVIEGAIRVSVSFRSGGLLLVASCVDQSTAEALNFRRDLL